LDGNDSGVRPVDEPAGEALVSKDVTDRAAQVGTEKGGTAVAILPRSREHGDGDQQASGAGDDEPLPSVDLLACVVTAGVFPDGVGALDAPGVQDPAGFSPGRAYLCWSAV
jgi:hypothetical protein